MAEKEPTIDELKVMNKTLTVRINKLDRLEKWRYRGKIGIGILLYVATARGLWWLSDKVLDRFCLNNAQAAVIVVSVLGWCGLVAVVMFALAEREDT